MNEIVFADMLRGANVQNGVARLQLGAMGPDGTAQPSGQLLVPLGVLPAFVASMADLLRQLEARSREQLPA
ncbi:MAG: hypothetical protein ACRYG6_04555 [Janthinobacterium lividum]